MGSKKKASAKAESSKKEAPKLKVFRLVGSATQTEYLFCQIVSEEDYSETIVKNVLRGICSLVPEQVPVQNQSGGVEIGSRVVEKWTWFVDKYFTDETSTLQLSSVVSSRYVTEDEEIYSNYETAINSHRRRLAEIETEKIKQQKLAELEAKGVS